jgi:hypothetical protein
MNRTLATLTLLGVCTFAASAAHAQSAPPAGNNVPPRSTGYDPDPNVSRYPKGIETPFNPTAEEAFVKEAIRGAGYSGVNSLIRDEDGTWHARAYKGRADVQVAYDRGGHITETMSR